MSERIRTRLIWRVGDFSGSSVEPAAAEILLTDACEVVGVRLLGVSSIGVEFVTREWESTQLRVGAEGEDIIAAADRSYSESEFLECMLWIDSSGPLSGVELELPLRDPQLSISRILPSRLIGE